MGSFVQPTRPRVPNPVNPSEDFADKWSMPKYGALRLEDNFRYWLVQAQQDLRLIREARSAEAIVERADLKFSVKLNPAEFGVGAPAFITAPRVQRIVEPAKPWQRK